MDPPGSHGASSSAQQQGVPVAQLSCFLRKEVGRRRVAKSSFIPVPFLLGMTVLGRKGGRAERGHGGRLGDNPLLWITKGCSLLNPGTEGTQEQSCGAGVLPVQSLWY